MAGPPPDRAAWLAERRTGIGSSDAAAVCGLSPFAGALDVYLDKLGLLPDRPSAEMRWGLLLEDVIAAAYQEQTGRELCLYGGLVRSREHAWMLATPDRVAVDRVVELKTARTDHGWGEPGTDQVPEAYLLQVQHQLAVLGHSVADVAVLVAGSDFRVYTVPRSDDLIARLVAIEAAFWERVVKRDPPAPDWADPRTPELVALLHPPAPGVAVDLGGWEQHAVEEYQRLGEQARACERQRDELKAKVIASMGPAAVGRLPDGREVVRRVVPGKSYTVDRADYVSFTIRKGKTR